MKTRFLCLVIFFVVLVAFDDVKACTCTGSSSPISEYKTTPVVFVGTVKSIAEDKVKIDRFGEQREIRTGLVAYLDITDPIKGVKHKEATVITGGGGGDCGFHFEVGESYLIFASPLKSNSAENIVSATVFGNPNPSKKEMIGDVITTHICTLTNNLKDMDDELEMIRNFLAGKPEPRIYGSIREYIYEFDGSVSAKFLGFLPNIKVVAEGRKGKYESITNEKGEFRIKGLPVGQYNLKFLVPNTYMNLWSWERFEYPIEIKTKEESVEINLATQTGGVISGRLLDSTGKPVADHVQLSLIPIEFADEPNLEKHSRSEYTKNGKYAFEGVKQGKYILGVSIAESPAKNTPYRKTYFPSGNDVSSSKIIEIETGQKITNADFKLPKKLTTFVVEGFVVSNDGKPVAGADVNIYDAETPSDSVFGFSSDVKTDLKGRFKITGFKGRKYLLRAYKDTDYFAGKGVQSEQVEAIFDETQKPVKLVLNKNGIFLNQLK
jgi:hypothetical protein